VELDARTAADGTRLSADICIVGAGPVGLTLANALQDSGLQVLLIESGDVSPDAEVRELNAGETFGDPCQDLRLSRARGIGGTSGVWNTLIRDVVGGKYLPLDDIDFERKDWMPWSGWPFGRKTLEPYYRRAQAVCGLGPFDYRAASWSDARHPLLGFSGGTLTNGVYQFGPADLFRIAIRAALVASPAVTLVHGATVTELMRTRGGTRVTEARWMSTTGRSGAACAAQFVLAAGGIENARQLLLYLGGKSDGASPESWVGRGFMEHPIDASLQLTSRCPALLVTPSFYALHSTELAPAVMGRIALPPELLREQRLANASVRLIPDEVSRLAQAAGPRGLARRVIPFPELRRVMGDAVRRGAAALSRYRPARYRLLIDLEQFPHPDNRVQLSTQRDRFGQPQAALHWRWRKQDEASRERIVAAVARELQGARLGRVRVTHRSFDPSAHHHSGTTRMHVDPELGVVDEGLRVHGEENLFVTGSSVFPTAGFANPTLTAIALTLRLADHLGARW
jgi:choline dehydrogenase-like flavoprotein